MELIIKLLNKSDTYITVLEVVECLYLYVCADTHTFIVKNIIHLYIILNNITSSSSSRKDAFFTTDTGAMTVSSFFGATKITGLGKGSSSSELPNKLGFFALDRGAFYIKKNRTEAIEKKGWDGMGRMG